MKVNGDDWKLVA